MFDYRLLQGPALHLSLTLPSPKERVLKKSEVKVLSFVSVVQLKQVDKDLQKKFFEVLIKTLIFSILAYARQKRSSGKAVHTISAFRLCSG
jgi:hypothetical protein